MRILFICLFLLGVLFIVSNGTYYFSLDVYFLLKPTSVHLNLQSKSQIVGTVLEEDENILANSQPATRPSESELTEPICAVELNQPIPKIEVELVQDKDELDTIDGRCDTRAKDGEDFSDVSSTVSAEVTSDRPCSMDESSIPEQPDYEVLSSFCF